MWSIIETYISASQTKRIRPLTVVQSFGATHIRANKRLHSITVWLSSTKAYIPCTSSVPALKRHTQPAPRTLQIITVKPTVPVRAPLMFHRVCTLLDNVLFLSNVLASLGVSDTLSVEASVRQVWIVAFWLDKGALVGVVVAFTVSAGVRFLWVIAVLVGDLGFTVALVVGRPTVGALLVFLHAKLVFDLALAGKGGFGCGFFGVLRFFRRLAWRLVCIDGLKATSVFWGSLCYREVKEIEDQQ